MPSYVKAIADAMVTILQAVPGAPALVEWRKADVLRPKRDDGSGDPDDAVLISGPHEAPAWRVFDGGVGFEYAWKVSYYSRQADADTAGDDTHPAFLQAAKKALSVTTLPGTPVWDFEIADRDEWERQEFRQGVEASYFGVLYRTSEPTN